MPHLNNKTKIQTHSSVDRSTTSLSLAHHRENKQKLSTSLTLYKAHKTTGPTLGGQKPKGKKNSTFFSKEFNFPWSVGKGDLKHNNFKKKKRKRKCREILHEWRSKLETQNPNKWRGNRKITWKRIQNDDSKDDQKPWKQNGENARIN